KRALRWVIDNFFERNDEMKSDPFSSGGCEWCLTVYPKGYLGRDDLTLFLRDPDAKSLRPGWKRRLWYCFLLLNQSGQEHLVMNFDKGRCKLFCADVPGWGNGTELTLTNLQEKGFLEKNQLIIEVYINVLEVVLQGKPTDNDMLDYHGVQIIASQCYSVDKILKEHPEFTLDLERKNQGVQLPHFKLLIGLIQTLIIKSPQSLSLIELNNAQSKLSELTEAGLNLEWLRSKLEEISLESKKALSDGSRVQQLEERVKNVELAMSDLKVELEKHKINSASAAAIFPSFEFIDFLIKRFFLSCFSISRH
ncbi:MATH domain and coiled-coil domain-containing protein At2g42460-like, partial [Eutrema salsugineum]|uniref:MATH domain and coiled-coil domain-containing protein At2g42460-like n=1 Tax=Eutrema salsugineum TaxID=72664 RepID=UPI000CED55AC